MTSLTPCRRCHRRNDCETRAATLRAIRGMNITKANLRCRIPEQDFPPGSVVDVKAFELGDGWQDGYRKADTVRRGIVCRWRQGRATVVLNADQEIEVPDGEPIGFLKAEPDRLTRVDEPVQELCRCGNLTKARCEAKQYPTLKNGSDWLCYEGMAD